MPKFTSHVQFEAITINVTAKNKREANKKIRERIAKVKPLRILDRQNTFIHEQ